MNDGSSLYRARFQWQPTLTAHDPSNILTLNPAPVTYTFTGDVALTFAVASPQTATYAEPVAITLTFDVASPQTATYAEPVSVALTFGVDSAFEFIPGSSPVDYSVTGDVALSFGVNSAFQFIAAERPVSIGGGGGGARPTLRPAPVVFEYVGHIALQRFSVASPVAFTFSPGSEILLRRIAPRSSRQFINVPPPQAPLSEADQLVLAGV